MKKAIILLIALAISTFAIGQEEKTESIREAGLTFRNLDNFGFSYKVGTKQSLWRINAVSLSGNSDNRNYDDSSDDTDSKRFGLGFSVGKEYRKQIAKNFEYRYGLDFSFAYNYSKNTQINYSQYSQYNNSYTEKSNLFTPGVNLVFGLNYILGENLILGAELMPYITYTFGKSSVEDYDTTTDYSNFSYGFDSSSVLLSLAYRF